MMRKPEPYRRYQGPRDLHAAMVAPPMVYKASPVRGGGVWVRDYGKAGGYGVSWTFNVVHYNIWGHANLC